MIALAVLCLLIALGFACCVLGLGIMLVTFVASEWERLTPSVVVVTVEDDDEHRALLHQLGDVAPTPGEHGAQLFDHDALFGDNDRIHDGGQFSLNDGGIVKKQLP